MPVYESPLEGAPDEYIDDLFKVSPKACHPLSSPISLRQPVQKLDFDGSISNGFVETPPATPPPSSSLPSPATPLLFTWNYLDDIPEDSPLRTPTGRKQLLHHQRYRSQDNVIASQPTSVCSTALPQRKARHSLPVIFQSCEEQLHFLLQNPPFPADTNDLWDAQPPFPPPKDTSDTEFLLTLPRSITEPPEAAATSVPPLEFVMEDPSRPRQVGHYRRHSIASTMNTVYTCSFPTCEKAFSRYYNLQSHFRSHTSDRPYICQQCDTSFSRCHDLKRHEKTHTGSKPFQCERCQKMFSRNDALARHIRLRSCPLLP